MRLAALARRLAERASAAEALASAGLDNSETAESGSAARGASVAPSLYGSAEYWDARYASAEAAVDESSRDEWYVGAEPVLALLAPHVSAAAAVGVLGCGLSALPAALARAGYARVRAVDASEVAIERMRLAPPLPGLSYEVADVRRLTWPSGSMDALVDKATLDTALNADARDAEAMLAEAARALRRGGVLLCVTTGAPEERLPLLLAPRAWAAEDAAKEQRSATPPPAAPCFEAVQHTELHRGLHTFHAYVLRRM